jgi:hypothetical protein
MNGQLDSRLDLHGTPYPNYVDTDELRIRWNLAKRIAEVQAIMGGAIRGSGEFNLYVWHVTRTIFDSDLATGSEEEVDDEDARRVLTGTLSIEVLLEQDREA